MVTGVTRLKNGIRVRIKADTSRTVHKVQSYFFTVPHVRNERGERVAAGWIPNSDDCIAILENGQKVFEEDLEIVPQPRTRKKPKRKRAAR